MPDTPADPPQAPADPPQPARRTNPGLLAVAAVGAAVALVGVGTLIGRATDDDDSSGAPVSAQHAAGGGVAIEPQAGDLVGLPAPIIVQNDRWTCTTRQVNTVVIVQNPVQKNGLPWPAGINLGDGCTGTIAALVVMGNQRDGVKVGGTAHDLEILTGWIGCGPRAGTVHQDGVQAGGGTHVHFHNLHVDCPQSNNSSFFVNQTNGGSGIRPTDITCTNCDLLSANNALNVGADSTDSGARNSLLRKGTGSAAPANCARVNGTTPVDSANVCIPPNPAIDTGQPVGETGTTPTSTTP